MKKSTTATLAVLAIIGLIILGLRVESAFDHSTDIIGPIRTSNDGPIADGHESNDGEDLPIEGSGKSSLQTNHEPAIPRLVVGAVEYGTAEYLTAQDHIQDVMPHPVTVLRSRLVLIDSSWLDRAVVPAEISLQLFEDTVCHAKHKGVKDFSSGSWVWIGSCELRGETPVRLHKSPQGYIRGTIQVGGTKYVIDRVAKNIYVIYHVNPAKYYQVD